MCSAPKVPTVFSTSATMSSSRATSVRTNKALPSRSNLLGELLSLGNAAPGDDHIRAFFGKRQDSGFADARVTSSNKDSLVFEGFHNWPQRSECRFFGKVNGAPSFATLGPPKGNHGPGRYEEPSPSESLWRTVDAPTWAERANVKPCL